MSDRERQQNYWVLRAMGSTNAETLLYCQEHRRITLTWEGEPFCCLKAALEARLSKMEEAGTEAFLPDDGLLWVGKAEDEHGYGMEFVGITLPKDRYFAFLKALANVDEIVPAVK
jgi:hypothetical protein